MLHVNINVACRPVFIISFCLLIVNNNNNNTQCSLCTLLIYLENVSELYFTIYIMIFPQGFVSL